MRIIKRLLTKLFNKITKGDNWELQAEAIWKTIRETNATLANTNATLANINATLANINATLDRVVKEREEFAKEIQKLRALQAQNEKEINKLREAQAETNKQMRETDKKIDKISKEIGGGLGRMAEGLTAPCVPFLFKQYGMNITSISQKVKALDNGKVIAEIDIIGVGTLNGKRVFLVGEVKAHLSNDDVKDFAKKVLPHFRKYYSKDFKELEDKETYVYGFVSGMFIDEDTKKFANRKGLYILEPKGETMHIINPSIFKPPKLW